MIKADNISFSYGGDPVFDKASFSVGINQKIGLVGKNGSGKSTLFKLILGNEEYSEGHIEIAGNIGFVPQEVKRDQDLESATSIRAYIDPNYKKEDYELKKLFLGLELLGIDLSAKPKDLSGGQKTKLALARALISEPDILLLDEPTNFMDTGGRKFVMTFLAHYPNTVIVVSHDLDLLDKHIDKVLFVNTHSKKIDEYSGNYSQFLILKKEKEDLAKREHKIKLSHIKQLEETIKKGRGFKSKKGARRRTILKRRVAKEKEELPELPPEIKGFKLNLPDPPRIGELPLKAVGISKHYDTKVIIDNLSFSVRRGEKFLLVGPNGSGKSTVIKILMKVINSDSGSVEESLNLKAGYYSQEFETFDLSKTLLDYVSEKGKVTEGTARGFLDRFMFDSNKVRQKIVTLSGGEKTRLSIALLMLGNNNLLVLDEPTTYLDPLSQRIVLEALKEYKGTLILVSHVEDFVKELVPHRALIMPEGIVKLWSDDILDQISEI